MRRLLLGCITSLVALAFAIAPASAISIGDTVTVTSGETTPINGSISGAPVPGLVGGLVSLDGVAQAYCIDTTQQAQVGDVQTAVTPTDLVGIGGLTSANLPQLIAIVNYQFPNEDPRFPLAGSNAIKSASVQAALWHFSNGFELDQGSNPADMVSNYNAILARVTSNQYPSLSGPDNTSIESPVPNNVPQNVGDVIGPFTVHTHAITLSFAVTGASRVDANGDAVSDTEVTDGEQFWLKADAPGTATVNISGQNVVSQGIGLFGFRDPDGDGIAEEQQAMLTTGTGSEAVAASVTVEFAEVESTTAPPTVGGVQAERPEAAPPAVQAAQAVSGSLPTTGKDMSLAWLAVALVLAGALVLALRELVRNSVTR